MAIGFIRDLVHPDVKYNENVVEFFLKALIHESIIIRKLALKVALFISIQNKPKFIKTTIDPLKFSVKKTSDKIKPGIRDDNKWLLYNIETVPKNEQEWNEPRFMHNADIGYFTWPKTLEIYAPPTEQQTAPKRMDKLTKQERAIFDFFTNEENINKLITYLSMEEKKGKDLFNGHRFALFKVQNVEILMRWQNLF